MMMVLLRVPRINASFTEIAINKAIGEAVRRLDYSQATENQANAIREFVVGRDVFVILPTGSGKSLCYAALPYVFDILRAETDFSSIVVVVCPLQSIMEDQVRKYMARGLQAAFIGIAQKDEVVREGVASGKYQLVYMSPEAMLLNLRWREMFRSEIYQRNLVCLAVDEAHCVEKWGVKFRQEFSNIAEIRSLLPHKTNIMALTATANVATQANVLKCLEMAHPYIICEIPNNPNLFLAVLPKPSTCDTTLVVEPIVQSITVSGVSADRYLVFCRSYAETIQLFQEAALQLNDLNALYVPTASTEALPQSHCRTCEKYDACTAENMKRHIVTSFTDPSGTIRVVFATIAFAMGLDSPNIRHVMHWGPPADIETYIQEVGRSGRDGKPATAILFYTPVDFRGRPGVSPSMKEYCVNTSECRRKVLMRDFAITGPITYPATKCLCCDMCAMTCSCGSCHLPESYLYFKELTDKILKKPTCRTTTARLLTDKQECIKAQLLEYRRQLCERAAVPSASLMVGIEISTGIPDSLIESIAQDYTLVQCTEDLINLGVTSPEHADVFFGIIMSCR